MKPETKTWVPFLPEFRSNSDKEEFIELARTLAGVPSFADLPARLQAVDQVRGEFAGARSHNKSSMLKAAVLVLCDLVDQGWSCRSRSGQVKVARAIDYELDRDHVRMQLHVQRDRYLSRRPVREFVRSMEKRRIFKGKWVSIFSLMRDGRELASAISDAVQTGAKGSLNTVIQPYIQVVTASGTCELTGFNLIDIWRYFRCTWANRYQSVPGRSLMVLIRDAAAPYHPVIGIAALGSSAVQIGIRDSWIGWTPETCVSELRSSASDQDVEWLLQEVHGGIRELYLDDLFDRTMSPLVRGDLKSPSCESLAWLRKFARDEKQMHYRLVSASADHKSNTLPNVNGSKRWKVQAELPLFRSKRAELLAMLLRAQAVLMNGKGPAEGDEFRKVLASPDARQAIQSLIRRAKAHTVGVAVADITVCGAVAPYSALLGGKLVAMLMASPEVIVAYRERYAKYESVIASSLAGRPIVRPPHLVFLGTTSLYPTEPTQYTRVHIPAERLGGAPGEAVRYRLLGSTSGFGTFQFSDETVEALAVALSQTSRGQRVNSIFGEGTSPRMRKIRDGLDLLNLPSDVLLLHGSLRLVYGVSLVRNLKRYLLGQDAQPDYLVSMTDPKAATQRIAEWWAERWLSNRITKPEILQNVASEGLTYPIKHSARVPMPTDQQPLPLESDAELSV
jgi:hypothetical protein